MFNLLEKKKPFDVQKLYAMKSITLLKIVSERISVADTVAGVILFELILRSRIPYYVNFCCFYFCLVLTL